MEILSKWNGNFRSNRLERKKWITSEGRSIVPFEPRVPFTLQPVEPEILAEGKAPLGVRLLRSSVSLREQRYFRLSSSPRLYFPVVLFIILCCTTWFQLLRLWMKPSSVTIHSQAIPSCGTGYYIMLYKVVLAFQRLWTKS